MKFKTDEDRKKELEANNELIIKLQSIQGQELKYKQLCEVLSLPYKTGRGKNTQLKDLTVFCDYDILDSPTRYIITKVYPEAVYFNEKINNNNKFQDAFDSILYHAFLDNHCEPLYLSSIDMMNFFSVANKNFKISLYPSNFAKMDLTDFEYMAEISKIVYKILLRWVERRIINLDNRNIIKISKGFRLYYDLNGYIKHIDVPENTQLELDCREIYEKAKREVLPKDWGGEWLNDYIWMEFKNYANRLLKDKFNGKYFTMKEVYIFRPLSERWLQERLKELPSINVINTEAKNKILNTKQLNRYTGDQREEYIKYNIDLNPPLWFQTLLYK